MMQSRRCVRYTHSHKQLYRKSTVEQSTSDLALSWVETQKVVRRYGAGELVRACRSPRNQHNLQTWCVLGLCCFGDKMAHTIAHEYGKVGGSGGGENIQVFVRARPPAEKVESDFLLIDVDDKRKLTIKDPKGQKMAKHSEVSFQFDHLFWTDTSQDTVFDAMVQPQVDHVLSGYNCCCFAYGQTGSGKTYSMFGEDAEVRGMIPRAVEGFFGKLESLSATKEVAMVCSFMEVYNDQIRDLGKAYLVAMGAEESHSMALHAKTSDIFESLAGKRGNPYFGPAFHRAGEGGGEVAARPGVQQISDEFNTMNYEIREDAEGNVFVKDLSMVPVNTLEEVSSMISMGVKVRATHETSMNANSSRSHTVFTITIIQKDRETGDTITGMLNLVDLAGSERLKKTESQGVRLKEALHINTSLTALSKVIMSLDPSSDSSHVPFRDSKLTRILQNSLGGNSFTTVLAAVHPNPQYYEECLSTLQFANRCRNVKNNPRVNYVSENEDKDRKIKRLQEEIKELQRKLNSGEGGHGHGGGHLSAPPMNTSNVVAIMQKMGLQAQISADGAIVLNGKKIAAAELGIADGDSAGGDSVAGGSNASGGGGGGGGGGFGGGGGGGFGGGGGGKSINPDKMRRIVAELQDSNHKLTAKSKEQKSVMEEQGRTIQEQAQEVVKYTTQLKHRDWEYQELFQEKERDLKVQAEKLKEKFDTDAAKVIENSNQVLLQQQSVIASVPDTFRSYSTLLRKTDTAREKFDGPIRKEFENHLKELEVKRTSELENMKHQYEHWLKEKDRTLIDFVSKFNKYRTKKSEHLRQCEKEIVTLYEYTEQLERILDNVEKGRYMVAQKQGQKGRSTTGHGSSKPGTANNNEASGGGVVIPKGLRPTNPLQIPTNMDLELTKRIVNKHKERQEKLEKVKEEAFHKSLHHASMSGTVTAEVDPVLQKQIRDLLVTPGENKRTSSSAKTTTRGRGANKDGNTEAKSSSAEGPQKPSAVSADVRSNAAEPPLFEPSGLSPNGWGETTKNGGGGDNGGDGNNTIGNSTIGNSTMRSTVDETAQLSVLRAEVTELRAARKIDSVNASQLQEELVSNETVQYVRYLEEEKERLHKQVRDISNHLHSAKVANSSLMRKLKHANEA